jgi:L-phenylalanine/L-methionine N-acetyltransferase
MTQVPTQKPPDAPPDAPTDAQVQAQTQAQTQAPTPAQTPASITVRRARPTDADDMARVMAEDSVYANLMQLPYPSEAMWRARLEEMAAPASTAVLLVAERSGHLVGSVGLHPAQQIRRRHVAALGISVDSACQRQGVGSALMQAVCDYADGWAHILRIELTVFTDNARAIALYQRFGFRLEGTHVAYALRQGAYRDVHAMARLHPQPPQLAWPGA